MPTPANFTISRRQDMVLTVPLAPPVIIGGWDVRFQVNHNFPLAPVLSGLIVKSMASGFYNVSGMNIVNSGEGIFRININSPDTSGLEMGNYAYTISRTNSGSVTSLTEGYMTVSE